MAAIKHANIDYCISNTLQLGKCPRERLIRINDGQADSIVNNYDWTPSIEHSNCSNNVSQIDSVINSRKTWPVAITTRAAIRMMRSNQPSNQPKHYHRQQNDQKPSSSLLSSFEMIAASPVCQRKQKCCRVLVFGSTHSNKHRMNIGRRSSRLNVDNNFLRKCRHNFLIESKRKGSNGRLIETYDVRYACGQSNVNLELCFLKWPDSYQNESEFYQQTFDSYLAMSNLAIGYYDPNDLESIEHMQSWIKAFYRHHDRRSSMINTVIIRIEEQRNLSSFLSTNEASFGYDHVISSLLKQYHSSMYHMTIRHRLFARRPSLKPLWKVMFGLLNKKKITNEEPIDGKAKRNSLMKVMCRLMAKLMKGMWSGWKK